MGQLFKSKEKLFEPNHYFKTLDQIKFSIFWIFSKTLVNIFVPSSVQVSLLYTQSESYFLFLNAKDSLNCIFLYYIFIKNYNQIILWI